MAGYDWNATEQIMAALSRKTPASAKAAMTSPGIVSGTGRLADRHARTIRLHSRKLVARLLNCSRSALVRSLFGPIFSADARLPWLVGGCQYQ
jgi:hypothetical protein